MSRTTVILLAGGSGSRMQAGKNKVLLPLCGKSVLRRSLEAFRDLADEVIVVCREEDSDALQAETRRAELPCSVLFVPGGETRQASVYNGLHARPFEAEEVVLVHDAARCLVSPDLIQRVIASVRACGSGLPVVPATNTCKLVNENGQVLQTLDRARLFEAQTPQGFWAASLLACAEKAQKDGFVGTDDASLLEYCGMPVQTVPGSPANIKLTSPEDLRMAEGMLTNGFSTPSLSLSADGKPGDAAPVRVGMGYDVHRLVEGRRLILCGVEIPHPLGLLGHSDADVALHALMDAMLGACALGDIGQHFPDTDPAYLGASSMKLLRETARLIAQAGFRILNADITIVAQKPRLAPHIPQMRENVASALSLPLGAVNVKATTTEKLGFEGRMEGISASAVCTCQAL